MGLLRKACVLCVVAILMGLVLKAMKGDKLPIIVDGFVEPGFEDVMKAFRENFESGDVEQPEGGSAFAAYYKGKQVVNIWGGYADYDAHQPWRQDSMSVVFSVTKGMAALCMAMLVDRGQLAYEQKVVHYWPEFGQNGKENVTVQMLLQHEAGLAVMDEPLTIELLGNYEKLGKVLARSPPLWEPGTAHGYHAITFGLYASQLLTRADPKKRTIGEFFRDEVAKPFGIEFYIGLPRELNYRVGRYFTDGGDLTGFRSFIRSMMDETNRSIMWYTIAGKGLLKEVIDNCQDLFADFRKFNDPENRALELASATGIGTAEGLAKVYGIIANGGVASDGKKLLSKNMIKSIHEGGSPLTADAVLVIPSKFSFGFNRPDYQGREMLGHPGNGGNNAYADQKYNLGVGFVTRYASQFGLGNDPRFTTVRDALYRSIEQLEGR